MMSKYFVCCEKCFDIIGRRNTKAARSWMDLCAWNLEKEGQPICLMQDSPQLRVLETLGFLVSTETENKVFVNVLGRMKTDDGQPFFCPKGGLHE